MQEKERQELPTEGDKGRTKGAAQKETAQTPAARNQGIVRTSVIGIVANLFLVAFKGAVGLASNSIAILLDAVNNLTDALSSVITIVGARAAGKEPDREHPLGHGRIEYLSALLVAALVLYAGLSSLVESVKKNAASRDPAVQCSRPCHHCGGGTREDSDGAVCKAQGKTAELGRTYSLGFRCFV